MVPQRSLGRARSCRCHDVCNACPKIASNLIAASHSPTFRSSATIQLHWYPIAGTRRARFHRVISTPHHTASYLLHCMQEYPVYTTDWQWLLRRGSNPGDKRNVAILHDDILRLDSGALCAGMASMPLASTSKNLPPAVAVAICVMTCNGGFDPGSGTQGVERKDIVHKTKYSRYAGSIARVLSMYMSRRFG